MQASWMLGRLISATQDTHATIDALWQTPLLHPTPAGYRTYLCTVYAFQVVLENALVFQSGLEMQFIAPRIRSGRIAADLLALGLTPDDRVLLSRPFPIPDLDPVDALGWLFVAERMMLRDASRKPRFAAVFPDEVAAAGSYLTTYEGVLGDRWSELGQLLDRSGRHSGASARMVAAAHEAYAAQGYWIHEPCVASDRLAG